MIGLLIGIGCALGFTRVLYGGRGHRHWHGHCYGRSTCGSNRSCDGFRDDRDGGAFHAWHERGGAGLRGFGARGAMHGVFRRLRTTREQEAAIQNALEDLFAVGRDAQAEMRGAARDAAKAMRGDVFSEEAVGTVTATFEHTLDRVRKAGIAAFAKIHGALDSGQRAELADLIERGASWR